MSNCNPGDFAGERSVGDIKGMIVHDIGCVHQAIILSNVTDQRQRSAGAYYPALVFRLDTGERVVEDGSSIDLSDFTHRRWHVAEHYVLGMDVPTIPPSTALMGKCACGFCDGECENRAPVGEACEYCNDTHGTCGCDCDCDESVYSDGNNCGYCDNNSLCDRCVRSHDINYDGYCSDCTDEIEEEERLEAEAEQAQREEEELKAKEQEGDLVPA